MDSMSRRRFMLGTASAVAATQISVGTALSAEEKVAPVSETLNPDRVRFSLNLGTLRNYELGLIDEIKTARDAGYRSVEIWFDRLADYARSENGRGFSASKLAELKKFIDGEGIAIEGAIGFAQWIVDDPDRRANGMKELESQAEALAALGAPCLAAPASGANSKIDLNAAADRYRAVLELCDGYGVRPLLELWGVSPALSKVSDCLKICADAEHPKAALLLDVYHLFRGGNSYSSLSLISGDALPVFHMNDYPGDIPRERQNDGDRVFPGDGAAPWREILTTLGRNGFSGVLSFEIFNRKYREKYSAVEQARIGLEKMKALFN